MTNKSFDSSITQQLLLTKCSISAICSASNKALGRPEIKLGLLILKADLLANYRL